MGKGFIPYSVKDSLLTRQSDSSPNRLKFVLPISSYVTIPLGSFSILLLFALMAQFALHEICERNQKQFYQEIDHMT